MTDRPVNQPCCAPGGIVRIELTRVNPPPNTERPSLPGMKRLPGGEFLMGCESMEAWPGDGEGPIRRVSLSSFWIDATVVTNHQFGEFIDASGYLTDAERLGWSYAFHKTLTAKARRATRGVAEGAPWWVGVEGACWRHPEGPGSNLGKRGDHPVVHVSWHDAQAYCAWAGVRLPSEAEWEYAARGGLVGKIYAWGDELNPNDARGRPRHLCNIWQGKFPDFDSGADGYVGTAPAKSYPPNGYGLYNVCGNMWEWCADWFSESFHRDGPRENPSGPPTGEARVIRGGSYLCHASYCNRYRVAARTSNTPDSTTAHCGFRCARDDG